MTTTKPISPRRRVTLVRVAFALAAVAAPATPLVVGAQSPLVLTLGGAARLAADKNASPEQARIRVAQAEARVRQSRADFLPSLFGQASDGERTFNSASFGLNFADPTTGKTLFDPNGEVLGPVRTWDLRGMVKQNIVDLSALARMRAARANVSAAGAAATSAAQQAGAAAAAVYIRAVRADAQLAARVADSTLASELLGIARDQLQAGVGIGLDVTRAQSQLAAARAQLIGARNERDRARLELQRSLGVPAGTAFVLSDSLVGFPATAPTPTETDAMDRALHSRADLIAADQQIAAGERRLSALKAQRLPSLAAFGDQGVTGKATEHLLNTYNWGIQLSIPIWNGGLGKGQEDEQVLVVRELTVRRRDLADQVSADVRAALLDLSSAREQLAASDERLAFAEQELAQARDRFQAGVAGNADVITASMSLNAARTQLVDARAGLQGARVALARAQGTVTDLP